ncbi:MULTISPECIES: GxxExxY protein [Spirosoma]|uniref:GxxExxY protein n=1 Tax=Spirosoma sordidisoli TaxID=2502893 RepID=A0A4Q2UKQ0_9BACT|nr:MULTISPECIES: GxxExxY protein [Spirosoma]RYC70107.1 GxxExxY protein [Spirosoma sordidisoli]
MNSNYQHSDLTDQILKSFYKVYNTLGYGFLEKVYENAMHIELTKMGMSCVRQQPIDVFYDGQKVGLYYADLVINGFVIVELKAAEGLVPEHEAQLTNYLRATNIEVGLLLNFGRTPQHKRKVFSNNRK